MNIYCNQLYFETEYTVCPFCILKPRERKLPHLYTKWENASEWQFSSVLREIFVVLRTERGDQKKKKVVCICVCVCLILHSVHPQTWSKIALKFVQHNLIFIIM